MRDWPAYLAVLISVLALCFPTRSFAKPTVSTRLSAQTVELGQAFQVTVQASDAERAPSSPELKLPASFNRMGPSNSVSHRTSIVNARVSRSITLTATWQLNATKQGQFVIGPASVKTSEGRITGDAVRVKVVAAGSLPQPPRRRRRRSIFDDPFGGFGSGSLFDDFFSRRAPSIPEAPPDFQVATASDPLAFLRATLSQDTAVVGEQITLRVYAYGSRGAFQEYRSKEPGRADFFSQTVKGATGNQPDLRQVTIGNTTFQAALIREIALFPLKPGELTISPMSIHFYGRNYVTRQQPEGVSRTSNPLVVRVSEAPVAGRPRDYLAGTVGTFELSADVAPRTLNAGDSFAVTVELRGTGQLPGTIETPEQLGLDWLEPTSELRLNPPQAGQPIGGVRTFTYVVRTAPDAARGDKSRVIQLGEVELPFFDPQRNIYRRARATLGQVTVKSTGESTASDSKQPGGSNRTAEGDLLAASAVRKVMVKQAPAVTPLDARPWYWWVLLGFPCATFGLFALGDRLTSWRRSRSRLAAKPGHGAKQALRQSEATKDDALRVSELEKAMHLSVAHATGLKSRAWLISDVEQHLIGADISPTTASQFVECLQAFEQSRFANTELSQGTLSQARSVCMSLLARRAHVSQGEKL